MVRSSGLRRARGDRLPLTHMGREGHAINPLAPPRSPSPSPSRCRPPRRARPHHGHGHHAQPLVIGHRGASGYRPEHTLASYRSPLRWAPTSSSPTSSRPRTACSSPATSPRSAAPRTSPTTPSSPPARPPRRIDGVAVTGWFTEDFTLAELKTLRAKERLPRVRPQNTIYDGHFEVPTFEEVLDLRAAALAASCDRPLGVYPETKHPTYFRSIGPAARGRARARRSTRYGLEPPRRAGVRAVLRDRQPAGAGPRAQGAARAAARRQDAASPATRRAGDPAPTATSPRPRACARIARYADGRRPVEGLHRPA